MEGLVWGQLEERDLVVMMLDMGGSGAAAEEGMGGMVGQMGLGHWVALGEVVVVWAWGLLGVWVVELEEVLGEEGVGLVEVLAEVG